MAWLAESLQWHSCFIKSLLYICDGLVLVRRHILKPPNVVRYGLKNVEKQKILN